MSRFINRPIDDEPSRTPEPGEAEVVIIERCIQVLRARYDPENTFAPKANVSVKPRELVMLVLEASGLIAERAALRSTTPASETPGWFQDEEMRRSSEAPAVAVDDDALAMLRRRRSDAESLGGRAEIDVLEIDEAIARLQSLLASVRVKDEALRAALPHLEASLRAVEVMDRDILGEAGLNLALRTTITDVRAALSDQQGQPDPKHGDKG